jgi:three-Cys-motif partner protein
MPYDEIGYWSEVKLDIVRDYAAEYSKILSAQKFPALYHVYIDAFAGAGQHISRATGGFVPGSPLNALSVDPPFKEYHFIDLNRAKLASLAEIAQGSKNVHIHEGDCNEILLDKIFPEVSYEQYRRGLCLLDPYGLHLNWNVIATAGAMKSLEVFLNFPIADMNRNVLWRDPAKVDWSQRERLNRFWGDETWKNSAYSSQPGLFGDIEEKTSNKEIVDAFRKRLLEVAGFRFVPEPVPMMNSQNAVIYYLFFASQKPIAEKIVSAIFSKYSERKHA